MGRPQAEVNAEQVEELAAIGCTQEEIATCVGCSVDTLKRRFAENMETGRGRLKMSLRRMQVQACERGNIAMLIWLGKQYLGQRDKQDVDMLHRATVADVMRAAVERGDIECDESH